jgi:hypothetical protein
MNPIYYLKAAVFGLLLSTAASLRANPCAVLMAQEELGRVLQLQHADTHEKVIRGHHSGGGFSDKTVQETVMIHGLPIGSKVIAHQGKIVLRHYAIPEIIATIRERHSIKGAFTPYVRVGIRKEYFKELTGVFFTLPEVSPDLVGLATGETYDYVDIVLPLDVPLMEIEANRIYVVPFPKRHPGWIKELYQKFKEEEYVLPMYHAMLKEIDSRGGINDELELPVIIHN